MLEQGRGGVRGPLCSQGQDSQEGQQRTWAEGSQQTPSAQWTGAVNLQVWHHKPLGSK